MIEELINIKHVVYQLDFINLSAIGRKLNYTEQMLLLQEVNQYVLDALDIVPTVNDSFAFIKESDIEYIEDEDAVNTEHYVEFAYFKDDNIISINKSLFNDVFEREDVVEVIDMKITEQLLLYHEIFHYFEKKYAKELKSITKRNYKYIGKRRYRFLVSELSAMHYTYIQTGKDVSPYILNTLLILNLNPDLARSNYNRITEFNKSYEGGLL